VFDKATADWTKCSTGGRLDANDLSDGISSLLVRGVANDIDVFHHDVCPASSFKGTIYIGDLDRHPALRVDLLIEIALAIRLAHCHCKSIFNEEFPVLGEVRELPGFVAVFGAGCNNIFLVGKIGGIAVDKFVHGGV